MRLRRSADERQAPHDLDDDDVDLAGIPPPPPPEDEPEDTEARSPSEMQGSEELYGYIVAAELLLASVISFLTRHSAGVPANQVQTWKYVASFAAALALIPVIRTRRRMAAGFASIIAAFVVSLPPGTKSQQLIHVLVLVIPLAYALLLTQRQRKATLAVGGPGGGGRATPAAPPAPPVGVDPEGPRVRPRLRLPSRRAAATPPRRRSGARRAESRSSPSLRGASAYPGIGCEGRRALRRNSSTALRWRTMDRAVGSTPRARSTSTSVATPTTVE